MNKKPRFPIGVSDFKKIATDDYLFVDKTLFIKDIMDSGTDVSVITRPRRFGKTLNLSMLHYFLRVEGQDEKDIFEGLKISEEKEFCQKHQYKYPIIFVSFKDIKSRTFNEAYAEIVNLLKNLYSQYLGILEILSDSERIVFNDLLYGRANITDVGEAIAKLSTYLFRKNKQHAVILIDEYDTPIQSAYLNGYYLEMLDLMRSILGKALKDNQYLYKSIITGITRVSQESLFSGVNNITVYSVLSKQYGQYFGMTEDEVQLLYNKSGVTTVSMEQIKEWYNGYRIGKYTLYNPWSILNCLYNDGELKPYWLNTASNELLFKLISQADNVVKANFELLLQGKAIEKPISENLVFLELETREEALWSLLLYAGYLNILSFELKDRKFIGMISIPNKEVSFVYDQIIESWFRIGTTLTAYGAFIDSLSSGNHEKFKKILSEYIIQTGSYFDFNKNTPEAIFHIFILGLVVGFKEDYDIRSNRKAGFGRCDVTFMPRNTGKKGIVLEFKTTGSPEKLLETAQDALLQIKDKKYVEMFKANNTKTVLAIGIAFCGKQIDLASEEILINQYLC